MKNPQFIYPYNVMIPGLEINVVVHVKMKDREQPIVRSRNYLPIVIYYNRYDFENAHMLDHLSTHELSPKQEGHHVSYDCQVERIPEAAGYVYIYD